jgi:hypothetical protein
MFIHSNAITELFKLCKASGVLKPADDNVAVIIHSSST